MSVVRRRLIEGLVLAGILAGWESVQPGDVAAAPLSTAFTYQGQINQGGAPLTGTADFQFSLYDALSGGIQAGTTLTLNGVSVSAGVFAALLDFGVDVFNGEARYLEIAIRSPAGGGSFTVLSPRVTVTATPYALQTRGIFVNDAGQVTFADGGGALAQTDNPPGVKMHVPAAANLPTAVLAESTAPSGPAVGVKGTAVSSEGRGLVGQATGGGPGTVGVEGTSPDGHGVEGVSTTGHGVHGEGSVGVCGVTDEPGGQGVLGIASGDTSAVGVEGVSDTGHGVHGEGKVGVCGVTDDASGQAVLGEATGADATGVEGTSVSGHGVHGDGTVGVCGVSDDAAGQGVLGMATGTGATAGVKGTSSSPAGEGMRGEGKTGVRGMSADSGGKGVVGEVTSATGSAVGVEGKSNASVLGIGVNGEGYNFGVRGLRTGPMASGAGVYGSANQSTSAGVSGEFNTPLASLPRPGTGAGVYGVASQIAGSDSVYGVWGRSGSSSAKSAGVLAEGTGALAPGTPAAAALEVRNGAIVVSGADSLRAAGTLSLPPLTWTDVDACGTDVGYHADALVRNRLVKMNSIILVTVEDTSSNYPFSANVRQKAPGEFVVRITALGKNPPSCSAPGPGVPGKVHYLILNPGQ